MSRRLIVGLAMLISICVFSLGTKKTHAAGEATNTLPADGTNIVVSAAGAAAGSFSSPESNNFFYVPANTSANVWLKNISNGPLFSFSITWLDSSGSCNLFTPNKLILYPSNGSTINVDASINLANQATVQDGATTLKVFCVMVTTHTSTSGSRIVNFQLESTPGTRLGVYAGTNTSTGTGFFANNGSKWSETISFAPSCTGSLSAASNHVLLYDLDNGWSQNPNIDVWLVQYDRTTGAYIGSDLLSGDVDFLTSGFGVNVHRTRGSNTAPWNNNYTWHVYPSSGSYNRTSRYELTVAGIGSQNKIRIRLPFDQINSTIESCGNPNPVGYADSCELVGNVTRVWGWGYENDNAGGPTVSLTVGGSTQTTTANQANYRVDPINSFLDARGYGGDARDNNYGWYVDYTGLRRGNTYGISGTLINSGIGGNQTLGISGAFTSNNIPDSCLPSFDAYVCSVNVVASPSSNLYIQQVYSISLTLTNTGTTTWDNSFSVYNNATDNPGTPYNEATHNNLSQNLSGIAPSSNATITFSNLSSNVPLQINYNFKVRRNGATPGGITPFDSNVTGCTGSVLIRYCPPGSSDVNCGATATERGGYTCTIPSLTTIEVGVPTSITISSYYNGSRTAASGSVSNLQVTAGGTTNQATGLPVTVSRSDIVSRDLSPFTFVTAADNSASGLANFSVPTGITGEADYTGSANCNGTIRSGFKPYFKVYGSDTWAGGVFDVDNGVSCAAGVTNRGGIYAFATGSTPDNYRGASGQLPVTALLGIDQYYSGSTIASHLTGAPSKGQTFANSGASTYGGNYGGRGRCHINYFNDTRDSNLSNGTTNVSSVSLPSSGKKQYIMSTGNQTIGALNIPKGVQIAVYVDGDAYITGSITFDSTARSSLEDIPNFALVAKGNIYVSSSVSRLDGLYVAQPKTNDPNERSGKIYTCTKSVGSGQTRLFSAAELYANCNSQLAVNGSLVAKQIKLQRVFGTLNTSISREAPNYTDGTGTRAGEVINYSPENFLAPSALRIPTENNATRYDSIRQLPPIY